MSSFTVPRGSWLLLFCIVLVLMPGKVTAFGAGNIPSIAQVSKMKLQDVFSYSYAGFLKLKP